jgi:plastocyanin
MHPSSILRSVAEEMMMKKTICLMALTAFALASSAVGCGDSGTGGAGGGPSGGGDEGGAPAGGSGDGGSGPALLNGCSLATADDQTAAAEVDIDWVLSTQECIRISAGSTVNWNGNFVSHPLVGGDVADGEAPGLITDSDQSGATASVTFAAAGEYPFFCTIHLTSMQGVIYVE